MRSIALIVGKSLLCLVLTSFTFLSYSQIITNTFPPSGKVGIGTTAPKESLHIADGTIIIDDLADLPTTPVDPTIKHYTVAVFDEVGKLQKATDEIIKGLGLGNISDPTAAGLYWKLNGNDSVLFPHYLGTNNSADLRIKTNSLERMSITSDGFIHAGLVNALKGMAVNIVSTDPTAAGLLVETDNSAGGYGILSNVVNSNTRALSVQQNSTEKFYVSGSGQGYFADHIGIGTAPNLQAALAITHNSDAGGITLNRNNALKAKSQISFQQQGVEKWAMGIDMNEDNSGNFFIYDGTAATARIFINAQGGVGIGTTDVGLTTKLAVEGRICARQVDVLLGNFPDYVFEEDYNLMSLKELESYINQHKHLPGFPSAKEVEAAKSVDLGEMNRLLLEKVEELTLHLIALDKSNAQLQKEVQALKAGNQSGN